MASFETIKSASGAIYAQIRTSLLLFFRTIMHKGQNKVKIALFATGVLFVPAYVFRVLYGLFDFNLLFALLIPLAVMLLLGKQIYKLEIYQALLRSAVKPESPLNIFSGKITSWLKSATWSFPEFIVLALYIVLLPIYEIIVLAVLCFFACLLFFGIRATILSHLHEDFASVATIRATIILCALPNFIVIAILKMIETPIKVYLFKKSQESIWDWLPALPKWTKIPKFAGDIKDYAGCDLWWQQDRWIDNIECLYKHWEGLKYVIVASDAVLLNLGGSLFIIFEALLTSIVFVRACLFITLAVQKYATAAKDNP